MSCATLKELRAARWPNSDATPSGLRPSIELAFLIPGLPKHNPGLELANAFSVVSRDKVPTSSLSLSIHAVKTSKATNQLLRFPKGVSMYLLAVLLVLLNFHPTQVSSSQTASSPILEIEQRLTAALLKKDHVAFGDLLSDDLVHISFDGQVAGKAEYMTYFKEGAWQYKKFEPANVAVKMLGNVAVVTGRVDRTIVINSEETTGAFAFTHVWSRVGDRWRLTSAQGTIIPTPATSANAK